MTTQEVHPRNGCINLRGEWVIPLEFDFITFFENGFAAFERDGRWGILNRAGKITMPPTYDDATAFGCGLTGVRTGEVCRYLDGRGVQAFQQTFSFGGRFLGGVARVGIEVE